MNSVDPTKLLKSISQLQEHAISFAIVTLLGENGAEHKLIVTEKDAKGFAVPELLGERLPAHITDLARAAISSGRPTALERIRESDQDYTVTIEVIRPKPSVVVFGAGHVGQAVALMASMIGYAVTAIDDRDAFANRNRLPDPRITLVAEPFDTAARSVQITSNTAIVIVTRGHQYDELCLRSVIESPARYIGMIGSRRRVISVFKQLTQSGVDAKLLDRVHAPIGLAISARSPQEIAVAIIAEIIQTFNTEAANSKAPESSH